MGNKWWQQVKIQKGHLRIVEQASPNERFPVTIFKGDFPVSSAHTVNEACNWCLVNGFTYEIEGR